MQNEKNSASSVNKITSLIFVMFLILVLFSVFNEIIDIPHLLFNSVITPINWNEIIIEVSFIIIVSIIVIHMSKKLVSKQIEYETELLTKNQEYWALNEEYKAQNEELCDKNEILLQEIEKRKLIEQQLKNQFDQFVTIYKNHPEILYVSDTETYEIIMINDNFKEILGYDPTGEKCYKALRGIDKPCSFCTNKIIMNNNGESYSWESSNKLLNRHFFITDQLIEWPDGRNVRLELAIDITERKKAEKEIKTSEEKFRSLFESMNEGVAYHKIICNKENKAVDYVFLDVNKSFEKFTGLKKEDILNKKVTKVIPEIKKSKPDLIKIYGEVALSHKAVTFELYFKPFKKWYKISSYSPSHKYFCAIFFDITLMKNAEIQVKNINRILEQKVKDRTILLETANKELDSFSYSVSHDLRAPLRAITGYANILFEDYFDRIDNDGKNILTAIQDNARNMALLIEDILEFSRLGRKELTMQELDMKILFEACYNDLLQHEENRKIEFVTEELPKIYGDLSLIKIVINNLLSNAIKFTKTRDIAKIYVNGRNDDGKYIFKIEDNGVGFNEKYKDKLFSAFQRLHSKREFEGTGVGLAIVQRIINKHKGDVWAESEINKGSNFYFSIPVYA